MRLLDFYQELLYFHDIEWCPDCQVLICHSCEDDCTLI